MRDALEEGSASSETERIIASTEEIKTSRMPGCSSIGVLLSVFLLAMGATTACFTETFNVVDYGADANAKTASTAAFQHAWKKACASSVQSEVLVPKGKFLVGPLKFKGPCNASISFKIEGTMVAATNLTLYKTTEWIAYHYVNGLRISGGGTFDGQGALAWPKNNCDKDRNCKRLPTSINLSFVKNGTVEHISSLNSKSFHMHLFRCDNMTLHSLNISAPDESPNTDGIHLGDTNNTVITNSTIGTGDDCISIGPGSRNISISEVFCGPGHGISVGSLGGSKKDRDVFGLSVRNCTLSDTQNGVRIKTWPDSPTSISAFNFTFDDIVMKNVANPVVIDQKYCPHNHCSRNTHSKVKISNIKFKNIRGESRTPVGVDLFCSAAEPCKGIELNNVDLKYSDEEKEVTAMVNITNVSSLLLAW